LLFFGHAQDEASPTDDEYAVYSAFLNSGREGSTLAIIQETKDGAADPRNEFDAALMRERWNSNQAPPVVPDASLVDSFARVRSLRALLAADRLKVPAERVIHDSDVRSFFTQRPGDLSGAWEAFHKQYGGGYLIFSRVGFNHDHMQTLLSVSVHCGGLCGTGLYVLLQKVGGDWRPVSQKMTWVS
jgi:hypothetical protein